MEFTERVPLEQGFAQVFHDQIRPALMRLEGQRVERLRKARRGVFGALGVGLALAAAIYFGFGGGDNALIAGIVVLALGVVGAFAIWGVQASGWTGSLADAVMPAVCDHVGQLAYDRAASRGAPTQAMVALGMLGHYDSASYSDRLDGRYRETGFTLVEATLSDITRDSKGRDKKRTVFKGLLFEIGVPIPVPTPILIARDHGAVFNKLGSVFSGATGRGMPRVDLDHARFESTFEVHAENPHTARDFMPPAFLDNLLAIGEAEGGRKGARAMVAGFSGDSFYLALSRKTDFLGMGSLSTPVTKIESNLHGIFDDIAMIHRIIDRLHGVET